LVSDALLGNWPYSPAISVHQLFLSFTELQSWALHAPRTNIVSHNKEGLVSTPGYLAIHLLGLSTGLLIFPPTPSHFRRSKRAKVNNSDSSSDGDEAYAKDAWIDDTKKNSAESKRLKHLSGERDEGKTAIELCSYGVLYLLVFVFVRLAAWENNISRVLVCPPFRKILNKLTVRCRQICNMSYGSQPLTSFFFSFI
jgi:glucosaminylphosphatidylinositol acyltransferase